VTSAVLDGHITTYLLTYILEMKYLSTVYNWKERSWITCDKLSAGSD